MTADIPTLAAELRAQLADQLAAAGALDDPAWRSAVEQVPREAFLTAGFYRRDNTGSQTYWLPTLPESLPAEEWLQLVYTDESWVTQLDGHRVPRVGELDPANGAPTSSSTLPSLVARMWQHLQVPDGGRVLEIGTGSGYSTALACHRLGDARTTSIEYDPELADRAKAALAGIGYHPTLVTGDGLIGHQANGPYDRIVATCSVRHIPAAWLAQTRPGGVILTALTGSLYGSALVRLTVAGDGTAHGRALPGMVSFMPARPHAPVPKTELPARSGDQRPTDLGPATLDGWTERWLAQLAVPQAQRMSLTDEGTVILYDPNGSWAWLTPSGDGRWLVQQDGPQRLWDRVEHVIHAWRSAGSPPQDEFEIDVSPDRQAVGHPALPGAFDLPVPVL